MDILRGDPANKKAKDKLFVSLCKPVFDRSLYFKMIIDISIKSKFDVECHL
jgi:hypothetical protein